MSLVLAFLLALTSFSIGGAEADSYEDEAYRQHDIDNMERTSGRQRDQVTDPAYLQQLAAAGRRVDERRAW